MRTTRDTAQGRDRRNKATATGCVVVLFTAIAAPILAIFAISFSDDRAALDAYNAAPLCAAGASATASCRRETKYRVSHESGHAGHFAAYYLYLFDPSGTQTRIQITGPTGVWPAAIGESVTVTSWQGRQVSVSDGRNVSQVVGAPALETGDGGYAGLCIVGALYAYLVLLAFVPRMAGPLLLVPIVILLLGIALHGRIVGGPWTHDLLFWLVAPLALAFVIQLLPKRRPRSA